MPTSDISAAGLALVTPDGHALFLKRGRGDHAGEWCLPGGMLEGDETPEQAAVREAREETGFIPGEHDDERPQVARHLFNGAAGTPRVNYTTFRQRVGNAFIPTLDGEHVGYAWAPLDAPPEPLHPGLAAVLPRIRTGMAADALALDRGSVRTIDKDGRLHVAVTNISKGNVCPYVGKEIPDYEALGLSPTKVYRLLRDPTELAKAVSSFNNLPVLSEHVPVMAPDYDEKVKKFVIGATGTDATFAAPYLKNSLVIWSGKSIQAIESDEQKEISSGYHYRADMTPGAHEGEPYDGVMRDIVGNHVAIVEEGRAGPDVVVGDSKENLKMTTETRFAAVVLSTVAGAIAPIIAKDQKLVRLETTPFRGLTRKNFSARRPALDRAIRKAIKGRLAKDAKPEQLMELLDSFEKAENEGYDEPVSEPQRKAMFAAASGHSTLGIPKSVGEEFVGKAKDTDTMDKHRGRDEEPEARQPTVDEGPMRDFLKTKGMDDASIEEAVKLMHPGTSEDEADDESEEERMEDDEADDAEPQESEASEEERGKKFAGKGGGSENEVGVIDKKGGKDKKRAKDARRGARDDPPPFEGMPKTKAAMDAMKKEIAEAARQDAVKQMRAVRAAEIKVEPHVGKIAIACDSAADVFKTALGMLGVKDEQLKAIPATAYEAVFDLTPKPTDRAPRTTSIAHDAAAEKSFAERHPNVARIRHA